MSECQIEERVARGGLDDAVCRARGEFLEMPGLRLTLPQAARLWAYDAPFCREVLTALVDARFLVASRDGFIRAESRIRE